MCGLVGCAGRLTFQHEKAFKQLLKVDELRGEHSVGIAAINQANWITLQKKAMPVTEFLDTKGVTSIFSQQLRCLIGHNRFATKGKVNNVNAHPFLMDNVVGAHNGSLVNMSLLPDHQMFDVDSEAIYNSIDTLGVRETAARLHGAWALTWWDVRDKSIHMWRNTERPLYYVYTEDRKVIFWASEPWMLVGILMRNGIKHTELYEVTPHNEYKIGIPLIVDEPISDISIRPVEAYVPPVVTSYNSNYSSNRYQGGAYGKKNLTLVTKTTAGSQDTVLIEVGTKVNFYIGAIEGKKANGFMVNTSDNRLPDNLATHDCLIHNIGASARRLLKDNVGVMLEGTVCGSIRKNDGVAVASIQGNSLKVRGSKKPLVEVDDVSYDIDVPEDTIQMDGETLTRDEFRYMYSACTCCRCGMDLEFRSGHVITFTKDSLEEITCVDCLEDDVSYAGNKH